MTSSIAHKENAREKEREREGEKENERGERERGAMDTKKKIASLRSSEIDYSRARRREMHKNNRRRVRAVTSCNNAASRR